MLNTNDRLDKMYNELIENIWGESYKYQPINIIYNNFIMIWNYDLENQDNLNEIATIFINKFVADYSNNRYANSMLFDYASEKANHAAWLITCYNEWKESH
jgi:hypothetical protein